MILGEAPLTLKSDFDGEKKENRKWNSRVVGINFSPLCDLLPSLYINLRADE